MEILLELLSEMFGRIFPKIHPSIPFCKHSTDFVSYHLRNFFGVFFREFFRNTSWNSNEIHQGFLSKFPNRYIQNICHGEFCHQFFSIKRPSICGFLYKFIRTLQHLSSWYFLRKSLQSVFKRNSSIKSSILQSIL